MFPEDSDSYGICALCWGHNCYGEPSKFIGSCSWAFCLASCPT